MIMQLVMAKWKCKLGIYSESLMIEKKQKKQHPQRINDAVADESSIQ